MIFTWGQNLNFFLNEAFAVRHSLNHALRNIKFYSVKILWQDGILSKFSWHRILMAGEKISRILLVQKA